MIIRCEKEKNFIKFYDNKSDKPYALDLNTMDFFGKSGKTISSFPAGFFNFVRYSVSDTAPNYMVLLAHIIDRPYNSIQSNEVHKLKNITKNMSAADRLEAIGYHIFFNDYCDDCILETINDNFKAFVKARKENPNLTCSDFYNYFIRKSFFDSLPNADHMTEQMKEFLFNIKEQYDSEQMKLIAYYISHGLWYFFECERIEDNEGYHGRFRSYSSVEANRRTLSEQIARYFDYCRQCEVSPEKDFFKHYVVVEKTVRMNKKTIDNNKLAQIASKYFLLDGFSADGYTVILPKTRKDFVDEANAQNNCVYSYYLDKVLKEETLVVFIRKNENLAQSYITCEIRNGIIQQYLRANNEECIDKNDLDFKRTLSVFVRIYQG